MRKSNRAAYFTSVARQSLFHLNCLVFFPLIKTTHTVQYIQIAQSSFVQTIYFRLHAFTLEIKRENDAAFLYLIMYRRGMYMGYSIKRKSFLFQLFGMMILEGCRTQLPNNEEHGKIGGASNRLLYNERVSVYSSLLCTQAFSYGESGKEC